MNKDDWEEEEVEKVRMSGKKEGEKGAVMRGGEGVVGGHEESV